jgi:signal transduction histidine kinase
VATAEPGIRIEADHALLRTALLNLFVNAVKYNEPRGKITAELEARENRVYLSLGNSGPGIP